MYSLRITKKPFNSTNKSEIMPKCHVPLCLYQFRSRWMLPMLYSPVCYCCSRRHVTGLYCFEVIFGRVYFKTMLGGALGECYANYWRDYIKVEKRSFLPIYYRTFNLEWNMLLFYSKHYPYICVLFNHKINI